MNADKKAATDEHGYTLIVRCYTQLRCKCTLLRVNSTPTNYETSSLIGVLLNKNNVLDSGEELLTVEEQSVQICVNPWLFAFDLRPAKPAAFGYPRQRVCCG